LLDSGPRTAFVQRFVEKIFNRANVSVKRTTNAKLNSRADKTFFVRHFTRALLNSRKPLFHRHFRALAKLRSSMRRTRGSLNKTSSMSIFASVEQCFARHKYTFR